MNAVTELPQQEHGLNMVAPSTSALVLDSTSMDSMMRLAEIMATGKATIPNEYRNSPGDCLAVVMQAIQWKMNPFQVAQKTHFVSGKIGYEAQLVSAVITSMAPTKDRLNYEWFGPWEKIIGKFTEKESKTKKDDHGHPVKYRVPGWELSDEEGLGVKVWATLKGESSPRELTLMMAQARTRNSTLWADDPRQQLAYLATKRWARLYTPDVILGVYTPDEIEEAPRTVDMGNAVEVTDLAAKWCERAEKATSAAELEKIWKDGLAEIKPKNDREMYDRFKATVERKGKLFTAKQEATPAATPADVEDIVADLYALADSGKEILQTAWDRLSEATRSSIEATKPGEYDRLMARAKKADGGQ